MDEYILVRITQESEFLNVVILKTIKVCFYNAVLLDILVITHTTCQNPLESLSSMLILFIDFIYLFIYYIILICW